MEDYIDPLSLEKLEEHRVREYFKIDRDWINKIKEISPEDYQELIEDWNAHEADAKFWRDFETTKSSSKLSGEGGYSQTPTIVVPRLLHTQMRKRFGPQWGAFNFLRYGIWVFYPKLRPTHKYHAKKRGISKHHVGRDFNTNQEK